MRGGRVTAVAAVALSLFLAGACGGSNDVPRPTSAGSCEPITITDADDIGSGPVDCHALDNYDVQWIDDFETGAGTAWYTNNDRSALQVPPPDSDPVPGQLIPGGRCLGVSGAESRYAIHIRSGVLTDFGGVLGRNMRRALDETPCPITPCFDRPPPPPPRGPCGIGMGTPAAAAASASCITGADATQWDGIVVWARKGEGSGSSVRVHISDRYTDDSNQACVCNPYTNQNDTTDGCDKFGSYIVLDGTWRAYFVPFDEMQQGGWGRPSPGIDKSGLFSLAIDYGRAAWDLWIDDIGFYRSKP
jgi:hypothetical protein